MRRVPFLFVLGLLSVSLLPSMSQAQASSRRRLIRLDAEFLAYATGSLVYPRSDSWFVGGEAGLGWKRVRFGTRFLLGWTEGEGFVAWEPLFLRFRF
ncbi:MAG: hypothetical protein MUO50_13270 [Longimicrobiales bacterium]|nr:hypothetical protein [Longimicrobiales bacterium]